MKTIKYLSIALLVAVFGVFFATKTEAASTLKNVKMIMADSRPIAATNHTFTFNITTGASLKKITFEYCKVASTATGVCGANGTGTNVTLAARGTMTGLGAEAEWTRTITGQTVILFDNTDENAVLSDAPISIQLNSITNSSLADNCDAIVSTDTCFVWIKTYAGADGDTLIDEGTATYTLVDAVVVTARVDPTFTFVIATVGQNTVNNGITTSVGSSSTTLPFGSLTAQVPKYAAHALYVTTNTVAGYYVTATMNTALTGVVNTNNIDPFMAPWGTPTTWTEPTGGTPNEDTGWVGANTTDTDIGANWVGATGKFGSISGTPVNVSQKANSDNGTVPVIVTYALEANVFQPADFYTGALTYNAIPTY
jgi:hypothetical protein